MSRSTRGMSPACCLVEGRADLLTALPNSCPRALPPEINSGRMYAVPGRTDGCAEAGRRVVVGSDGWWHDLGLTSYAVVVGAGISSAPSPALCLWLSTTATLAERARYELGRPQPGGL